MSGTNIGRARRRARSRLAIASALGLASLLLPAAPAAAAPSQAFVYLSPGSGLELDFGPPGFTDAQNHRMEVKYEAGAYRLTDSAGVVAGEGCNQIDPNTASCPDGEIVAVVPRGGAGDDTIAVDSVGPGDKAAVHGFRGDDRLTGSPAGDWLVGYAGNDTLDGRGGDDELLGGPSNDPSRPDGDFLDGGPGSDYISGDSSTGGNSIDTVTYADRSEPIRVTLGKGFRDDGGASDGAGDPVEYIENVLGGSGNDFIQGYGTFEGNNDNRANVFRGGAGADVLISDEGPDRLFGDAGADRLLGGPQQDRLTGGGGRDFMKGQGQKDLIFARDGVRDLRIDCGPGGRWEAARRDRRDPRPISC